MITILFGYIWGSKIISNKKISRFNRLKRLRAPDITKIYKMTMAENVGEVL
jgi:hypothetical protein